jgi:hypothetical protein
MGAVIAMAATVPVMTSCSACAGISCRDESFLLLANGKCITSFTSDCQSTLLSCAQAVIPPPIETGSHTCSVVTTFSDGTTLSFSVEFVFKSNDHCCGTQFDINPPAVEIGSLPPDAGAD